MKSLLVISVIMLGAAFLAVLILFRPAPGNLARYLWWRLTPAGVARTGYIRSADTHIHYYIFGKGAPILLLHGGLSHRLSWFSQVPWLVESGRQVILVDTRGHGRSGLGKSELSYRLLADDAIKVLDRLGIRRTDVIGWSDGANTALRLAHDWPGRVAKIVAISANADPSGLTQEARASNDRQDTGLVYWLRRWWTGAGERFAELEKRIKQLWRTRPALQAADLQAITTPTLLIVGEHDDVVPAHAREMAALLPHGRLAVIRGGGHATLMTHAGQVNVLIGEFLNIPPPP